MDDFREEYFSRGTLGAINYVVGGLREMPGRKAVILLSDSIKLFNQEGLNDRILESVRQLTDLANRASVVIYSIDPRGLPTLSLTAADNVRNRRTMGVRGVAISCAVRFRRRVRSTANAWLC